MSEPGTWFDTDPGHKNVFIRNQDGLNVGCFTDLGYSVSELDSEVGANLQVNANSVGKLGAVPGRTAYYAILLVINNDLEVYGQTTGTLPDYVRCDIDRAQIVADLDEAHVALAVAHELGHALHLGFGQPNNNHHPDHNCVMDRSLVPGTPSRYCDDAQYDYRCMRRHTIRQAP